MPLILSDRVKVRSRTVGTSAFVLEEAFTGFRNFNVIGDGNETFYGITDISGNWEIGRGTYALSTATLTRDSILSSSNNGLLVDFPAGAKTVFCTLPASAANEFVYNLSAESAVDGGIIRLAFSEGSVDDVKLTGSDGITVTRTDENTIDISALAVTQSAETTSGGAILRLDRGGTADDIVLQGTNGTKISRTDANTINIDTSIAQGVAMVFGI